MADNDTKTDAQIKAEEAAAAQTKADDAAKKAENSDKSTDAKRAEKLAAEADDARAAAAEAQRGEGDTTEATKASELKADSAVAEPDRDIGDHHAQRFSNTPENPPLAKHLDPDVDQEDKVKLVMTTSDTIAAGKDAVCYVHEEMVQSYLNAGWRKADAA